MFNNLAQYMNPNMIQKHEGNRYYWHYIKYLSQLTYQLFEWENLPETVDPRYMEMMIHTHGYVGFFKDEKLGYMAVNGAAGTHINRYLQPTVFKTATPDYDNRTFDIYNFGDNVDLMDVKNTGIVIWNNDMHLPSMDSIMMFAQDLAELKEIIRVNQNAQKTPVLILAEDTNKYSLMNFYNQYEGNAPVIVANKNLDANAIKVHKTDAPFVVDKLNDQKNAVWSEFMTWLGINNSNIDKKERLVQAEATSNNEQIEASGNIMLKARQEAVERIKQLYPELSDLNVKMRTEAILEIQSNFDWEEKEQNKMEGNEE